jgi:hypothetical protein
MNKEITITKNDTLTVTDTKDKVICIINNSGIKVVKKFKPQKLTPKQEFVCAYLGRSRLLKNNKLPYGIEYLNLVARVEEMAEKKFEQLNKAKPQPK